MKSKNGYILLEVLLGVLLLSAGSIMLLHSSIFQRSLCERTQSEFYAYALIERIKQAFEGFLLIQPQLEGNFPNGQPYEITTKEDSRLTLPLERLLITLQWKDLVTQEVRIISDLAVRVR